MRPVAALAAKARMTEGQLYSVGITLVAAGLLSLGLGDVHGVAGSAFAEPPLAQPGATLPPVVVPTPAPTPSVPLLPLTPSASPAPGFVPVPEPAPSPEPIGPSPIAPSPTPPPAACDLQSVSDTGKGLVTTLDALAGGNLPEKDLLAAIGVVTGCDPADPAVIAVGLLIGIGNTLPDPGIDPPVIPVVELPDPLITALQPARAQIDEVCGLVGTGSTVTSLFISAYPRPVAPLVTQVLFQSLSLCGQLRKP
jgi:hypothetical protein